MQLNEGARLGLPFGARGEAVVHHLTSHSTGRAMSKPFIENLSVAAVRARRLIRAFGVAICEEGQPVINCKT
jgi:hypothetical protein